MILSDCPGACHPLTYGRVGPYDGAVSVPPREQATTSDPAHDSTPCAGFVALFGPIV